MASVLRVQVAAQVDEGALSNAASQRATMAVPEPLQNGGGTHKRIALGHSEARVVSENPFVILQLESGRPTSGEVEVDRRAQHGTASGHGWAAWRRSATSTLA
jgi:hypothetical protein